MFQSPEVLKVHSLVAGAVSGGLVGHADLCDEPRVARALTLKQTHILSRENASWKETCLQKPCDGPVSGVVEPGVLLLPQPGHHPLPVLLVPFRLILAP